MSALRLLTVVTASLLLLKETHSNFGVSALPTTTYSVTLDHDNACLTEINDARKKGGLNELIAAKQTETQKRLPEAGSPQTDISTWVWKPVCDVLLPQEEKGESSGTGSETKFQSGTYAFQVVDASIPSCNAVVDNWKKAYTNFDGLPPPNKNNELLYKKQDNVSLVAIYNPSKEATADCRVVTCSKKVTTSEEPEVDEDGSKTVETKGYAVICMTTPDILSTTNDAAPFTEEQWGKIVSSIKGSASAVVPSLLGLVASLGLIAVM